MMRIDSHCHIWIPENEKYPYRPGNPKPPEYAGSIELLLELMEENNVAKAALVQQGIYGNDNSYMQDCVERYPGRFAGTVRVDQISKSAPSDLEYWVKQRGASAVRLTFEPYGKQPWDAGRKEYRLWEKIGELGIPVGYLMLPSHTPMIEDMLKKFPEVPVILDHLGKPTPEESPEYPSFQKILDLAARYTQVYTKLSALKYHSKQEYPHHDMIRCVEKALKVFGAERMMWATDFCTTHGAHDYHRGLEVVEKYMPFIHERDREWIFAKTALKLYRFGN